MRLVSTIAPVATFFVPLVPWVFGRPFFGLIKFDPNVFHTVVFSLNSQAIAAFQTSTRIPDEEKTNAHKNWQNEPGFFDIAFGVFRKRKGEHNGRRAGENHAKNQLKHAQIPFGESYV